MATKVSSTRIFYNIDAMKHYVYGKITPGKYVDTVVDPRAPWKPPSQALQVAKATPLVYRNIHPLRELAGIWRWYTFRAYFCPPLKGGVRYLYGIAPFLPYVMVFIHGGTGAKPVTLDIEWKRATKAILDNRQAEPFIRREYGFLPNLPHEEFFPQDF
mmetsp:Transcript_3043/g.3402  ORF Transcript_3043/g.3402 Transcript_3043/m.3402 type:complete len:158 (-) Transcript_3043:88-561(-)|eukprot:CAMPEP_0168518940 /NCGR_PEP_ID=MMETSP0405-20121227/7019_1 /TAXON_ID=498012 /ORGANISM="Trichosphaerium sp, Strain Am-I-7 wt" /LENGTH=157 /DNA_ID=CAMNT_0008539383 /DNA_START=42 /DNA_END=515 /DNA_ORIENTATION=+